MWVQQVPDLELQHVRLHDLLKFGGTSLWWFIHTLFYASAKEAILTIEQTNHLLESKSPDKVLIAGMPGIGEAIGQVCKMRAVGFETYKSESNPAIEQLADVSKIIGGSIMLRIKETRRRRKGGASFRPNGGGEGKLLFVSPSVNWRTVWNYSDSQEEKRDVFMGGIMDNASRLGYDVVCVDVDYSINGRVNLLETKIRNDKYRWIPFEHYLTREALAGLNQDDQYSKLKDIFGMMNESQAFKDKLQYNSVTLWNFLQSRIRRLLSSLHVLTYARILRAANEMIRIEHPDAVIMSYETGAYARATIVAARNAKVPTIGVQHGFVSPESVEYMHRKLVGAEEWEVCPIPTKTAVGGSYTADLLTRLSSYPKESVVITGYPKYDDLAQMKQHEKTIDSARILSGIGLSDSKRTMMIASGGFHSKYGWPQNYDRAILELALSCISKREDTQLIVRLHPMEDGQMQRAVIREQAAHTVPVAIVKGERNDLLWTSDLFLTVNSITALEALILGKCVLMLDSAEGNFPTVNLGNAVIHFRLKDLPELIQGMLDDPTHGKPDEHAVSEQVALHANNVDGMASARVAEVVDHMIRSKE